MPDLEIRPNTVGETVDAVFKIYLQRFVPLIAIVAVVTLPVLILEGIVSISFFQELEEADPATITSFNDLWELITPADVGATFGVGLLGWIASALASGAVVVVVADAYLGRVTEWRDALQRALRHLGPLLIGSLLFALGVAAGIVAFIVPGVILAVGWSVFGPAIVIEDMGGARALGRSWELTRGRRGPVLGAFIVMFVITAVVGAIIGAAFTSGDEYTIANFIVDIGVGILTGPLAAVTAGVVYLELRARHEEFDRLLLSSQLHRPERPQEPPPMIR